MSNDWTNVVPQLLAQGLMALREMCVMPRLVNGSYSAEARRKGNTIDIPLPSAISSRAVTPAETFNSNVSSSPDTVAVTLDTWREAPFYLTDDDMLSVMDGTIPMQASEAIRSLANDADELILGKTAGIYGFVGTPGTTPFGSSSVANAGTARKLLNKQLAPQSNRRGVLDPDAEDALLQATEVLTFDKTGSDQAIVEGAIGRKLGFDWYMDQNVQSFTPGDGWVSGFTIATGGAAVGVATITIYSNTVGSGSVKVGDLFTVGGKTQQYVVTEAATAVASTNLAIHFSPALKNTLVSADKVTVVSVAYVANLAFHRDAFAWASRPLQDVAGLGNPISSVADPVSGVALRLEVSRQYKQTTFSYDILCGAALVRPDLAVLIFG